MIVLTGCNLVISSAEIDDTQLTTDQEGSAVSKDDSGQPTYQPTDTFYVQVELSRAAEDTRIRAVWKYVHGDQRRTIKDEVVNQGTGTAFLSVNPREFRQDTQTYTYSQRNITQRWPSGHYEVDIYLNDQKEITLSFQVVYPLPQFG